MRAIASAVALLAAVGTAPAAAQSAATHAGTAPPDIVVHGVRSKPSDWREAESDHVIVLSDGSEAELVRLTRNLERLHFLLAGLLGRSDTPDDPIKLRVTLIGDVPQFEQMDLRNTRWQQGPYSDLFTLSRYYDPREDGAVMASTRVDQRTVIERTTATPARVLGVVQGLVQQQAGSVGTTVADTQAASSALIGDFATTGMVSAHDEYMPKTSDNTIDVPAESLLYAGYAQHYLLSYFPAAYPRWYLDGFGQIFASFGVKNDNTLIFGKSPEGTGAVLDRFGGFPLADILDDKYLTEKPAHTRWTPIHAWLLTHFLFFSDTRRPQLRQYLAARAAGADAATAAQVFGDQKQLARELSRYFLARKPFEQVSFDGSRIAAPIVHRLSEGEAAFVKGRLELGARVVLPPVPPADAAPDDAKSMADARADAIKARDRWLDRLRSDARRWSGEPGAQLLLAEAECRSGNADRCLAAASAAQALMPQDAQPLAWRADALVQQALAAPVDQRPARLAEARLAVAAANRADPEAVEPLFAYYRSFADAGEQPPVSAVDGLQKAVGEVPDAPASRLRFATALAGRGQDVLARQVIMPVAAGPYNSPERPAARALVAGLAVPPPAIPPAPSAQPASPVQQPTSSAPAP